MEKETIAVEFLFEISHQLREALASCYGMAHNLAFGNYGFTDQNQQRDIENIEKGLRKILQIQYDLMVRLCSNEQRKEVQIYLQPFDTFSSLEIIANTLQSWHAECLQLRHRYEKPIGWPLAIFWQVHIPIEKMTLSGPNSVRIWTSAGDNRRAEKIIA